MKLVALMPVRNEDWVLGLTLRALLMWVDAVVVLLHSCTDGSGDIVEQVMRENDRGRVIVLRESGEWEEMRHRQKMLDWARTAGATHIAMVDADEILTGNLLLGVRNMIDSYGPMNQILQLPWVCLARGIDRYYAAGPWYNCWVSTAFADAPDLHWSSESRGGYDFHHREPMGRALTAYRPIQQAPLPDRHGGGLLHLQFLSERRLRAKQALYKMTEVIRWPGRDPVQAINARYNLAVYGSDPSKGICFSCPIGWWAPYAPLMKHLDIAAVPWQEEQIRRLIAQHGIEKFRGLDLFGTI
jgi:hypothetical protein